ncbi:E3 ubiquitin-protein ligase WAV3 [Ricinus communis]|uniref:Inter-alpha-trypsin inhibitor heavy chain H3, putative n=1 Tax=Ricinus communis TaxID=3988 RepID=B9SDT6_RICCO|nr:E3 ubiquitin-protein ligase WAV3 [Ricinus communis]EEF38218.1 Inter-alpha-trypsin inhibitor heavy chain H3 precursor, putative [Ricinus communis]|eukprot:XP_002524155.1 probable E3 ubiquitin-protein ligase EDA40 [Ricinus communis]
MSFNDDEQIVAPQDSGSRPTPIVPGRVQLTSINNNTAPLEESKLKVMLELTGGDSTNDRPGLDLVAVLDVSGSMAGDKIAKVKTAMLFVIKKLSPIDRLSVVKFSADASRLCPLRQITEDSQKDLENLINGLNADGATNITAGLQTGLKVLNDRSLSSGRVVGIILMSDGEQNAGGDAAQVPIGNVPVYTFGFGINHEPRVLKAIANNSMGGTFSDVQNTDNLSLAFSQCLAGLLTVVVQDLKLTVTRVKDDSTIEQVSAGSYPQSKDDVIGSVTVTFGDLYSKEVRKVIVDLLLLAVSNERGADVLEIAYSYSTGGRLFEAPPATITVRRTGTSLDQEERPEVITEETRLRTARMIKEARVMADESKLNDAREKLVEAQNSLEDVVEESNPLIEMMKSELQQLLKLMKSQEMYEKQGRPFALSSETSHDRQRFASRGDVESLRLFATPRMDKYLEQAKSFDEDPSKPLPSVDEDVKEELAANPLAPIAGPLTFYIQAAIQSLQAIEKIISRGL